MKSVKFLAHPLLACAISLPVLMLGCKGDTPSAPSPTFTITASAGPNGSISPAGDTVVRQGGSFTYTISADPNFDIQAVLVDGTSVGAVKTYTFTNLSPQAHTISATFIVSPPKELIANPSMEDADSKVATMPAGWSAGGWGTNTSAATWVSTGAEDGTHALEMKITAYTNGSREWFFAPVPVEPGKRYVVSDYYKSDVSSIFYIGWYNDDAAVAAGNPSSYDQSAPSVPAAAAWTKNSFTTVAAPAGVKYMTLLHIINQVGTLTIDNASAKEYVP